MNRVALRANLNPRGIQLIPWTCLPFFYIEINDLHTSSFENLANSLLLYRSSFICFSEAAFTPQPVSKANAITVKIKSHIFFFIGPPKHK